MLSKRSGLRILENIDNCNAVGVTKTTYSSGIYVNKTTWENLGKLTFWWQEVFQDARITSKDEATRNSEQLKEISQSLRQRMKRSGLLVPSDFHPALLPWVNTLVPDYG